MKKILCTITILAALASCGSDRQPADARPEEDASGFCLATDSVPDAILEVRYFSTYNFIGQRIDGYEQPVVILTKEAASALRKVSDELKQQGYRLKLFDGYRPQCAVDHFVRWSHEPEDIAMKEYFYPMLDKPTLFEQDYIMAKSGHTRGSTIDLTLFDMQAQRDVDMGGTFDWFGVESHPDYCGNPDTGEYIPTQVPDGAVLPALTEEQWQHRLTLRRAMLAHGFKPLDSEWWHFTLSDEPYPDTYFTFAVNESVVGNRE